MPRPYLSHKFFVWPQGCPGGDGGRTIWPAHKHVPYQENNKFLGNIFMNLYHVNRLTMQNSQIAFLCQILSKISHAIYSSIALLWFQMPVTMIPDIFVIQHIKTYMFAFQSSMSRSFNFQCENPLKYALLVRFSPWSPSLHLKSTVYCFWRSRGQIESPRRNHKLLFHE